MKLDGFNFSLYDVKLILLQNLQFPDIFGLYRSFPLLIWKCLRHRLCSSHFFQTISQVCWMGILFKFILLWNKLLITNQMKYQHRSIYMKIERWIIFYETLSRKMSEMPPIWFWVLIIRLAQRIFPCFAPMSTGFDSQSQLLCAFGFQFILRFFSGDSGFPLASKTGPNMI